MQILKELFIRAGEPTARRSAIVVLGLLALAFLGGRFSGPGPAPSDPSGLAAQAPHSPHSDIPRLYACPMNDVPPMPAPGTCPVCGMELIPLPLDADGHAKLPRLTLSSEEAHKADVVLGVAERRPVSADIRLFGQIEYDPKHIYQINAVTNGVIEKLAMVQAGDFLKAGLPLFEFSSTEILDNEVELQSIMKRIPNYVRTQMGEAYFPAQQDAAGAPVPGAPGEPGESSGKRPAAKTAARSAQLAPGLATADQDQRKLNKHLDAIDPLEADKLQRRFTSIRYRLRDFGFFDRDIAQILRQAAVRLGIINVRVPALGGILIENNATQGRYVNAGTPLMTIANPTYVWANLRAFESDYPWLKAGQVVELTVAAHPGEVFRGRISQIDPVFDPKTRTFGVNVAYSDKDLKLRPNMLVRAVVKADLDEAGRMADMTETGSRAPLVIAETAPLITGRRAVVFVASPEDENSFEAREVVLGPHSAGGYVVREGLREGERIVVNGAFKLDSELQIRAKPSMMNPAGLARLAPAAQTMPEGFPGTPGNQAPGDKERPDGPRTPAAMRRLQLPESGQGPTPARSLAGTGRAPSGPAAPGLGEAPSALVPLTPETVQGGQRGQEGQGEARVEPNGPPAVSRPAQ